MQVPTQLKSNRLPCHGQRLACGRRIGAVHVQAVNIEQLKSAKAACEKLNKEKQCQPIMVRLAWHDSGTFNVNNGIGGANATIRFEQEITAPPNAGLTGALNLLKPIKEAHPDVSWADLIQMSSAAAIKTAGGPELPMRYGRMDALEQDCGDTTGLPAGNSPFPKGETPPQHLRTIFHRMGMTDEEIVALSGAHTIGRAYKNRSGEAKKESTKYTENGPGTKGGQSWTPEWLHFDNSYFKEVKAQMDPDLLVLETDDCIFKDPGFAPYANKYHDDNDAFFAAYAAAHTKLSELGAKWEDDKPVSL